MTTAPPVVATIVINFERADLTQRCLEAVLSLDERPAHLIVIDNASVNDSFDRLIAWLDKKRPEQLEGMCVALLRLNRNVGFAAANNFAISWLRSQDRRVDFWWLLNNDARPRTKALQQLLAKAAENTAFGAVGSTLIAEDGRLQCAGGYRYWAPLTMIRANHGGRLPDERADLPELPLDYVCGASMLIRETALVEVGLLNECYFLYCEELDLARRLERAGFGLAWARESLVDHAIGSTIGSAANTGGAGSPSANLHENLSVWRFTWRHHRPWIIFALPFRLAMKTASNLLYRRFAALKPLYDAARVFIDDPMGPAARPALLDRMLTRPATERES